MESGLLKVLEHRRQTQRREQIAVGQAEARVCESVRRLTAAQWRLSDSEEGPGEKARTGAGLQADGRHTMHLRHRVEHEHRRVAEAVGELVRARERLVAAAREQAAVERLLAQRRGERDAEQARAERAMHDECAAARIRATLAGGC
ncbi:MAG: flagellar FliJ family protein [Armatimonadota bacterium]